MLKSQNKKRINQAKDSSNIGALPIKKKKINYMEEDIPVSKQQDINQDLFDSVGDPQTRIAIGMELEQQIAGQLEKLKGQVIQKMTFKEAKNSTKLYPYEVDHIVEEDGKLYAVVSWGNSQFELSSLPSKDQKEYLDKFNAKEDYFQRKTRIALTDEQIVYINHIINIQLTDDIVSQLRNIYRSEGIEPQFESEYQAKVFKSFMKQQEAVFLIYLLNIESMLNIKEFCTLHKIDQETVNVTYINKDRQLKLGFKRLQDYQEFVRYFKNLNFEMKSDGLFDQSQQVLSALKRMYKQVVLRIKTKEQQNNPIPIQAKSPPNIKPIYFGDESDSLQQKNIPKCSSAQQSEEAIITSPFNLSVNDKEINPSHLQLELPRQQPLEIIKLNEEIKSQNSILEKDCQNYSEKSSTTTEILQTENKITNQQQTVETVINEKAKIKKKSTKDKKNSAKSLLIKETLEKIKNDVVPDQEVMQFIIDFQHILDFMSQDSKLQKTTIGLPGSTQKTQIKQLMIDHKVYLEKALLLQSQPLDQQIELIQNYNKQYSIQGFRNFIVSKFINEDIQINQISKSKFFNFII